MAGRMTVEGNDLSGYVGVDPMYQNYANETERPYLTDEEKDLMVDHGMPTDEELRYELRPGQTLEEKLEEEEEAEKDEADDSDNSAKSDKDDKGDNDKTKTPVKAAPAKATSTSASNK